MLGWKRQAPFDRILVTAACAEPPVKLITQLTDSGILIAPIGAGEGPQRLTLFQRIGAERRHPRSRRGAISAGRSGSGAHSLTPYQLYSFFNRGTELLGSE